MDENMTKPESPLRLAPRRLTADPALAQRLALLARESRPTPAPRASRPWRLPLILCAVLAGTGSLAYGATAIVHVHRNPAHQVPAVVAPSAANSSPGALTTPTSAPGAPTAVSSSPGQASSEAPPAGLSASVGVSVGLPPFVLPSGLPHVSVSARVSLPPLPSLTALPLPTAIPTPPLPLPSKVPLPGLP